MIDFERQIGPWSVRAWGLVLNFGANALALYGAAGLLRAGGRWSAVALVVGLLITVTCVLGLACPTPDPEEEEDSPRRSSRPQP